MNHKRFKFSTRTLLVCVAVFAFVLAGPIRFGPHLIWLAKRSMLRPVESIPTRPLVVTPITEKFVACQVGPFSIDLPMSMRENFEVQRDANGVNLVFTDSTRTVVVNVTPMKNVMMFRLDEFPDKTFDTYPQLYREIAAVDSSDFSFLMTRDDLRWHKWLITNRQMFADLESIEHIDGPNVSSNLLSLSTAEGIGYSLEWATNGEDWKGAIWFIDQADNPLWIKLAASTFDLIGDPAALHTATDADIEALAVAEMSENETAE